MLYNPRKQRGYLYYKFQSEKPKKSSSPQTNTLNDDETNLSQEEIDSVINYLKNVVVTREENTLKAMLLETVDIRRKMIRASFDTYIQNCDFYFAAPHIVRNQLL